MVLIPENSNSILDFAKIAKDSGLDYAVIKPYSQHKSSLTTSHKELKYEQFLYLEEELKKLNDKNFQVIFREKTMKLLNINHKQNYEGCVHLLHLCGGILWLQERSMVAVHILKMSDSYMEI